MYAGVSVCMFVSKACEHYKCMCESVYESMCSLYMCVCVRVCVCVCVCVHVLTFGCVCLHDRLSFITLNTVCKCVSVYSFETPHTIEPLTIGRVYYTTIAVSTPPRQLRVPP